uniref:Uncharacterized protein n=1 Tax=Triticum urartu TaxID=4572 RepID=A0A8R7Q1E3_TRIUA
MRVTIMERKVSEFRGMETDRQRDRETRRIMCSTESKGECGAGQISLANREHIPALETDLIMA